MNWQELSKKNEQAFKHFLDTWDYYELTGAGHLIYYESAPRYFHERDLYDFFDNEGIRVAVEVVINEIIDLTNPKPPKFYWKIFDREFKYHTADKFFPTRTEAEEQAFLRAFQLLEEKLKEGR